ncbi:MAG: putative LPS assembly protein LptD [Candidatus Marinimicrobia bacterium]|nr:putative LPS assembly protein LptD [Candidatus Neomarinimicrobiota bacterium]
MNRKNKKLILSGVIICLFNFWLIIPSLLFSAIDPLILKHAEELHHVKQNGESYIHIEKNVFFQKGEIQITCDHALHYPEKKLLVLEGNVTVWDSISQLKSEKIAYQTDTDQLYSPTRSFIYYKEQRLEGDTIRADLQKNYYMGRGRVFICDTLMQSMSDSAFYDYHNKTIHYYKNAVVVDSSGNMILKGDYIRYHVENKDIYTDKNPVFIRNDSRGEGRLIVYADLFQGNTESRIFTGHRNIRVLQDSLEVLSDSLDFSDSEGFAIFKGNPRIFYKENRLSGEWMKLAFQADTLQYLNVVGHAKMETDQEGIYKKEDKDSTALFTSTLTGRDLWVWFHEKNKVDYLEMKGMAESDYYVFRDSLFQGLNHASGDTVRMMFTDDTLERIRVIRDVRGTFYPYPPVAGMDTTLTYKADKIDYNMIADITDLIHHAEVIYADMTLKADTIRVDWTQELLYAFPQKTDTGFVNIPVFIQGSNDPMYGEALYFNFRTQRGRAIYGFTTLEGGIYTGRQIQKREDDPLYVEHARFTTCDLDENPHYWIESQKMILIPNEIVIAKPLVLYIMNIPVFYLPFGLYPDQKGKRRSGWFMPTFGTSTSSGWYLKGVGYYWAPNDYMDTKILVDFYDLQGIKIRNTTRYALRYKLHGELSASYNNNFIADQPQVRYDVNLTHQQTLGLSSHLYISGSYTNDRSYYQQTGTELDERLNQKLISNATYTTRIRNLGLSINASRTEDLITGNVTGSIPQISLSKSTSQLFKKSKPSDPQRWYHSLTYNYSSNFQNRYSHTFQKDSTYVDDTKNRLLHQGNISLNHKFFNWLTVAPGINIQEGWVFKYYEPRLSNTGEVLLDSTGKIILDEKEGFKRRGIYSTNIRLSSKFYGIFYLNMGRLEALRHVISPSVSFSYTPDFSHNSHYIFRGHDVFGNPVTYDYFSSTLLGNTPFRDTQTMNWSIGNQFSAKISDTKEKEKSNKYDFLTLNLNGTYNFNADSLKWSPINISYRASKLPGNLQFNGSIRMDPYRYDIDKGRRVDDFESFPRLTNFSFDTGFQFKEKSTQDTTKIQSKEGISGWQARISLRYSYSATIPTNSYKNLTLNTTLSANLSPNWSIDYTLNLNVINQKIIYQYISLKRDLHCWEMSLNWTPTAAVKSFFLRINVKSPLLSDALKLEKRGGRQANVWR